MAAFLRMENREQFGAVQYFVNLQGRTVEIVKLVSVFDSLFDLFEEPSDLSFSRRVHFQNLLFFHPFALFEALVFDLYVKELFFFLLGHWVDWLDLERENIFKLYLLRAGIFLLGVFQVWVWVFDFEIFLSEDSLMGIFISLLRWEALLWNGSCPKAKHVWLFFLCVFGSWFVILRINGWCL